jgi:hypothetical protein
MRRFVVAVVLMASIVALLFAASRDGVACQNRYAVLICGDTPFSAYQAYVEGKGHWSGIPAEHKGVFYFPEFWNDINRLYDILIENAGFSPDDIFVLWGDGRDWTETHPDMVCCRYFPHHGPVTDFAATTDNVRMVLHGLRAGDPVHGIPQMTSDDCLFIYTFDHGSSGPEPDGDQWGDALLCLMDGLMTDTEFSDSLNSIAYEKRTIFMQQCFSGGFIDNLTVPPHDLTTSINTACAGYEGARPADDQNCFPDSLENEYCPCCGMQVSHGEFNYYFMSAFQWHSTWVPTTLVCANLEPSDFYISSYEAAEWVRTHESTLETPQYKDEGEIGHLWILTGDTCLYSGVLGDVNGDSVIDVADITELANYLFRGAKRPCPWKAADVNCDCKLDVGDLLRLIGYVFRGESAPHCDDSESGRMSPETGLQPLKRGTEPSPSKAEQGTLPKTCTLFQNYPNPFNPETDISYDLPKDSWVRLSIYNIRGQKVKTLVDEFEAAGHKSVTWNGRSQDGNQVASGVYFYKLETGEFTAIRKMVLLR